MGTPVPDDSEVLLCPLCWGSGKPFGGLAPPLFLTIVFADIEKTVFWSPPIGEPLDGSYLLKQSSSSGCHYRWSDGLSRIWLNFNPENTSVQGITSTDNDCFQGADNETCYLEFENSIFGYFSGGTATVILKE